MNAKIKTENHAALVCAIAMSLACALVASNAHADDQARSETVKFADLNLDTSAGAEALYGRIHAAARRVCDDMPDISGCVTHAERGAIGKVNAPLLTAYYEKRTGTPPQALTAKR